MELPLPVILLLLLTVITHSLGSSVLIKSSSPSPSSSSTNTTPRKGSFLSQTRTKVANTAKSVWNYLMGQPTIGVDVVILKYVDGAATEPLPLWDEQVDPESNTTFLIIHGYLSSSKAGWVKQMAAALYRQNQKSLILLVDWSKYSRLIGYSEQYKRAGQAVGDYLLQNLQVMPEKVHCIGHSLGAHFCGVVANAFRPLKLRRITGLDPAGPAFTYKDRNNRLDSQHADFVDVIHTSLRFGYRDPLGHVDFYIGGNQSSMARQELCEGSYIPGCSHSLAHQLFISSVEEPSLQCSVRVTIRGIISRAVTCAVGFHSEECRNDFKHLATSHQENNNNKSSSASVFMLQSSPTPPFCK